MISTDNIGKKRKNNKELNREGENEDLVITNKYDKKQNKPKINKKKEKTISEEININIEKDLEIKEFPKIQQNSSLKIYGWNVNGIRAIIKKGKFQEFLEKEDPDFICLGETKIDDEKLKESNHDKLFKEKYLSYWNCCKVKKGYSGVAIFTKFKPINITHGINNHEHDQEGRVLTLEYENFFLVAVYVPNSGAGCRRLSYRVYRWDLEFQNYLYNLKTIKDVIVCGDMNVAHNPIDLKHPKANEGSACYTIEERSSLTNFFNRGFTDTFRHLYPTTVKYSYFSSRMKTNVEKNVGWRLDYFITNHEAIHRVVDSEILNFYRGSDHTPIKLTWKV